jgi:frataxin-like iron-binding protein CyaY
MVVNGVFDPNDEAAEQIWVDGKMSGKRFPE